MCFLSVTTDSKYFASKCLKHFVEVEVIDGKKLEKFRFWSQCLNGHISVNFHLRIKISLFLERRHPAARFGIYMY